MGMGVTIESTISLYVVVMVLPTRLYGSMVMVTNGHVTHLGLNIGIFQKDMELKAKGCCPFQNVICLYCCPGFIYFKQDNYCFLRTISPYWPT